MNSLQFPGLALGSGTLVGANVSRLAFLDEAGISRDEQFVVVSGVVVHADRDVPAIESELYALVAKHIPLDSRDGFYFHAKDMWSGHKIFGDPSAWSLQSRLSILHDLVDLIVSFKVPIVFGVIDKKAFWKKYVPNKEKENNRSNIVLSMAFCQCLMSVEKLVRQRFPEEIAMLFAEDHDSAKTAVNEAIRELASPIRLAANGLKNDMLPFERVKNGVSFTPKELSPLLQLADTCAFFVRGQLNGKSHIEPFFEKIRPLVFHFVGDQSQRIANARMQQYHEDRAARDR